MKKIKTISIILVLCGLLFSNVYAKNIALFLHGFESVGQVWTDRGTTADFLESDGYGSAIVDDYLNFDYDIVDFQNTDSLFGELIAEMAEKDPYQQHKWIIVGHSLGGLFARGVESTLRGANFNIAAILTIGAPHLGAPVVLVDEHRAEELIGTWAATCKKGPDAGLHWLAKFLAPEEATKMSEYLDNAHDEGLGWLENAKNARDDLKPVNGRVIKNVQSASVKAPYHSIIGAERGPTIMRWTSELDNVKSCMGLSNNATEKDVMDKYKDIKTLYKTNWDLYNYDVNAQYLAMYCLPWRWLMKEYYIKASRLRDKANKWKQGYNAWRDLDNTWAEMIGAGSTYQKETLVYSPGYCIYGGGGTNPKILSDFETLFDVYNPCPRGETYVSGSWVRRTVSVKIARKNDGLIQTNMALWNESATLDDTYNPYYDDVMEDGGWNHSEMMRYTRVYPGEDTGKPGAEIETPLKANKGWMKDRLR